MAARRMPTAWLGEILLLAALGVGVTACNMPNQPMTTAAAEASEPMNSGEILHVLQVINEGEIKQAELAMQKSDDPQVLETAQMIIRDHTASNERIAAIAEATDTSLEESPLSKGVQVQASKIQGELTDLSGPEFDRTYLQRQVELHEVALETVRSHLLPNAADPQVRQLLTASEPRLEQHRRHAEESYASIQQRPRG